MASNLVKSMDSEEFTSDPDFSEPEIKFRVI